MITLSSGLKNSLVILEFLRNDESLKNYDISIGTFTNCRECGLTFAVIGFTNDEHEFNLVEPFTWCIYEHRNSDSIIINGKKGLISLNGDLPYCSDNKWADLASFSYNLHYDCADKLIDMIKEYTAANIKPKKEKQSA